MQWYLLVLKKYADFKGRASRSEYWMFVLFNFLIIIGLNILTSLLGAIDIGLFDLLSTLLSFVFLIYALGIIVPGIAVVVRRLHDTNKSGWLFLLNFVPFIGWLIVLAFMIMDSQPEKNQYGEPVKGKTPEELMKK